jgi:hypothetical protein
MLDLFLFEKIETTRLKQRGYADGSGAVYVRMKDREGDVRLSQREWDTLGGWLGEQLRPTARALRLSTYLAIPFAVALCGVIWNVPALRDALDWLDGQVPVLVPFLMVAGYPLAMMARHILAVRSATARIDAVLAEYPRVESPPRPPRAALNTLEILALVLVGPHLLVQIYGTIHPNGLLNTPLTGQHLDWSGAAGLGILAGLLLLRRRAARAAA